MSESHAKLNNAPVEKPPITDSWWFWVAIYGSMAVLALAAIAPKHSQRQERLDRMSHARQDVWRKQVEGRTSSDGGNVPEAVSVPGEAGQPSPENPAASETSSADTFDGEQPKTRAINPLPMLLIVAAVLWLAGSLAFVLLPRLSRRYYPRFTHDAPPPSQAPS